MSLLFGIFIILHGLIHLLYLGQSARFFELKPGMVWPDGSWALSRLNQLARNLTSAALLLAALGLIIGGIGIVTSQVWWRPVVVGAVTLSSVVYILSWNGSKQNLDGQGAIGLLIDVAILLAVLVFGWP